MSFFYNRFGHTKIHNNEDQRVKEEKLVADIINRVKQECEAQGSLDCNRRGYSRRSTIMNLNQKNCKKSDSETND